jgi:membrane protein DedA with SNARE-associated domain
VQERLRSSQVPVLLVSRLIPGGRVPVLLAAGFAGVGWRTFVVANLPACALWSVVYAAIGLAGGSIFAEPWQGVAAAVVLILVINQSITWFRKR